MSKIVISKLNNEDIHKASILIKGVHNATLKERTEFLNEDEDFEKYLKENMNSKDYVFFKANCDNTLVGVCTCNIKHVGDGVETRIRDILFIEYIAVDESYRRSKIGSMLLDEVKLYARENNIYTVELNVWGFNSSAIKFYEKNGMRQKRIIYEYITDMEEKI